MPIFIDPAKAHWVPVENTELARLRDAERRLDELVEAVEWLVECEYFYRWVMRYHCQVPREWMRVVYHARSEVDRLIGEVLCVD